MDSGPLESITPEQAAVLRPEDVLEQDDAYLVIKSAPPEKRTPRFTRNGLVGVVNTLAPAEKDSISKIGTPEGWVTKEGIEPII